MPSNPIVSQILVESGAYADLEKPVIFTSGELGISYVHTDKIVGDAGKWEEFGDDSERMIAHAVEMTHRNERFKAVIDVLAQTVEDLNKTVRVDAISGGQRRDWLFSGPVAEQLGLMHIALYKQDFGRHNLEISNIDASLYPQGERDLTLLTEKNVIHIADLLTIGSSCYRWEDGLEKGWFPLLRGQGANAQHLITVVTRLEGGEDALGMRHINVYPLVAIDDEFLRQYSKFPDRAIAYRQNPQARSEAYLQTHGALDFVEDFNPEGRRRPYAKRFFERYNNVLQSAGKLGELEIAVQQRYGKSIPEIIGGR